MLRGRRVRICFAPDVPRAERGEIFSALSFGLASAERILIDQSRVKMFYRLDLPKRSLFVKGRSFSGLPRRLGRTFRRTKEEEEFSNYISLREAGISCPEPVCVVRVYGGPLILQSLLMVEYLRGAVPLREVLMRDSCPEPLMDGLADFFRSFLEKGLVHEDLQWENIVLRPGPSGWIFYLVDPLHLRWIGHDDPQVEGAFCRSVTWFFSFLMSGGAPPGVQRGLLDRLGPIVGLRDDHDRRVFLQRAQGLRSGR